MGEATEMEERVARAICLKDDDGRDGDDYWEAYLDHARAAIRAMREPTNDMLSAMAPKYGPLIGRDENEINNFIRGCVDVWKLMIDAGSPPDERMP